VLPTVPILGFGLSSGLQLNRNHWTRFHHMNEPNSSETTVSGPVPLLRSLWISDQIHYFSFHCMTVWCICKLCIVWCSFTSCSPNCSVIGIHQFIKEDFKCWVVFYSHSTNIDRVVIWWTGGKRASNTASITYISQYYMITTQLHNQSQSSEILKSRLRCVYNLVENVPL
jgi:hypothetical protein